MTLGDAARDDTALTDALARLRALGNWAMFAPRRPALTADFLGRLRTRLERAEPGSLAAVAAGVPAGPHTAPLEQVPQWLFAFDAAGMASFRALALLVAHPDGLDAARADIAGAGAARTPLPALRAALLEAVRLWPTTPARPPPPGQNLVLFLTAGPSLAACVPIRRDRPLPGTLDPFRLRFTLTPHPRVRASP